MSLKVSIIIPAYNEEGSIVSLINSIESAMQGYNFEICLVDDGSSDNTYSLVKKLGNPKITLISFTQNCGQSAAIFAGLQNCTGDLIALLDADLQNNPGDIPFLITYLEQEGLDMVQGYRKSRKDSLTKILPSVIANFCIRTMFGIQIKDVGCSLKVFRRTLVGNMIYFEGFHRLIPLIAHLRGYKVKDQVVDHRIRKTGYSKYGLSRSAKVMKDIFRLKRRPEGIKNDIEIAVKGIERFE